MSRIFGYDGTPSRRPGVSRHFRAFFMYVNWCDWSLGFHVCLRGPNLAVHVPMGFFQLGWTRINLVEEDDGALVNVG